MAAGFMISRILMLCLLNEVTCVSGLRTANAGYEAWQDGGQKQEVHGYRRPLHYVRFLRQMKISPERLNPFNTWQNSPRSLKQDLTPEQTIGQTLSHLWPQRPPVQPAPQKNYPLVQPQGFKVSLDLPFYKPSQMKGTDSATRGYERNDPKLQTNPSVSFLSGFTLPKFQNPERDAKKDPYVGKNIHGVSTSNFQVNLPIPFPAASLKPLKITGHAENKDPINAFLTSFMEPGERLSSIHMELKSPTISQTAGEQNRRQLGLTWSNHPDTEPKRTPQWLYESTYSQPTDDKLTLTWQLNQHKTPQQRNENPLARQSLTPQRPDSIKLPSLPFVKYLGKLGLTKAQKSPQMKDDKVQPYSTQALNLSPLQYNMGSQGNECVGSPMTVWNRNSCITSGAAIIKDLTGDQKGEKELNAAVPSLPLEFSFPIKTFLSNLTRGDGDYLNIKGQRLGSLPNNYMEATKPQTTNSSQTELKWPILSLDAGQQRTTGLPERKRPILNVDMGPIQKTQPPYVPVTTKPTEGKPNFSSWFPSQQVGQDGTTRMQSWIPKNPEIGKPQFPGLAISKYLDLIDVTRPLKNDKFQTIQPKPSQFERIQSLYSSLKPSANSHVQGQTRPSVSLSASTHDPSPYKPSSNLQQNVETTHSSSHHPPLTYGLSPFNSPKLETFPAEESQTWQKPVSSLYLDQYNNGRAVSYDTLKDVPSFHSTPSGYQTQKKLPEQDHYGRNQDGKGYYAKPFDTDGGSGVYGQTYQTGKNTAGTPLNVQPPCESSFSRLGHPGSLADLHYPYLNAGPQLCNQVPCMDGVGKCFNEPEKQSSYFPQGVSYSPTAEATSISIPFSTFERVFTHSAYQPAQNAFKLQQYPVEQRHPKAPTKTK